jgi:hypothetical protein
MSRSAQEERSPVIIYEENKAKVINALKEGRVDYLDTSSWAFQDSFFAFLLGIKFFQICGSSYPSPRHKEEVPIWFQLAGQTQLKLHQQAAYSKLPGLIKSGPILTRLKFNIGGEEGGFNNKNKNPREVPVDFDCVRKFFKDTDKDEVNRWHNENVIKFIRHNRGIDKEGIFLLDQTHLVVPYNTNYKGAEWTLVDEHGQRIETKEMTEEQKKAIKPRLCYSLSLLVHLGADGSTVICGYKLGGGNDDELAHGPELVRQFIKVAGKGVMKKLIMDRGYISGEFVNELKTEHDVDVVIPLRKNMNALKDTLRIADKFKKNEWTEYRTYEKKGNKKYTESVLYVGDVEEWENTGLKVYVSLMKTTAPGEEEKSWGLCTTFRPGNAGKAFDLYKKRTRIEEVNKQIKTNWRINKFSSPHESLIEAHVLFTLLTYSLIQLYLMKKHLIELANRAIHNLKIEAGQGINCTVVYYKNYFAVLNTIYYTEIILGLEAAAKNRLKKWIAENKKRWHERDG